MKNQIDNNDTIGFLHNHSSYVTVYIGNLSYKKTSAQLKGLFQKFGSVSYVNLVKDPKTEKSKGIAFVQMKSTQAASKAVEGLNGTILDGRTVKVSIANDRIGKDKENIKVKPVKVESLKPKRRRRDKGLKVLQDFLNK